MPLLSGFHESQPQPTGMHSSRWDQWSDLWTTCTLWFETRPRDMEPVLESSEDRNNEGNPFPVDIFTSASALQANIVMHMSAIVLLMHRPRLAKLTGPSARLKSRSWHTQKIARILVGNHFQEQWDPIAIVALLFVAKEMSHVSQQKALLSCFQAVVRTTQIPVEKDVASLRESWRLIYQEHPPDASHVR